MAAIPSSGSLVATHDYYRRRLGSSFYRSSCGSPEYPGDTVPHPRVSPRPTLATGGAASFLGRPPSHS